MSPTFIILCSVIGLTSGVGVLPDSVNAAVGWIVGFATSLDPTETPFESIKWSFEETNIITHNATSNVVDPQYKDRIKLVISTGSLALWDLVHSDAGNYSVIIQPAGGAAAETGTVTLNIIELVSDVNITANSTDLVEFNDTVTLSCSASGPALSFSWFNGTDDLTASDRVHFSDRNDTVTIDPVLRYDRGSYQCRVTNPVSSSYRNVRLSVSYGPDFAILESKSEHYLNGSSTVLTCREDARPSSQYSWFVNERKLWDMDTSPYLEIQMHHTGNYSCEAFNNKTLRRLRSKPVPITVWDGITNPSLTASNKPAEGSLLNLTCDASGSILSREWTRNDVVIKPSKDIQFSDGRRVLSIRKLTALDNGLYTCKISNPVSSSSAQYTIDITPLQWILLIAGLSILAVAVVGILAAAGVYLYRN